MAVEAFESGIRELPSETVYRPKRMRAALIGLVTIALGMAVLVIPNGDRFLIACGFLMLVFGVAAIYAALMGRPRLTVNTVGVCLETLFSTQQAEWGNLTSFQISETRASRRKYLSAVANIVAPESGRKLFKNKKIRITDAFLVPLADIVADLNVRRQKALGPAALGEAAPAAVDENRYGVAGFRLPWLTFAILLLLIGVFAVEQIAALDPPGRLLNLSVRTLTAIGGLNRTLVLGHDQWYRLFTAPLLHSDATHILFNGIALLMIGFPLERLVGRVWFFAFFVIGALGGSFMSLALNPATIVSIGASGAIMGLFAAALTTSYRLPSGSKKRWSIQMTSMRVLVPTLLPFTAAAKSGHIDFGAHLGGAVAGALAAYVVLKTWPEDARLPRLRKTAWGIVTVGGLAFATALAVIVLAALVMTGRIHS